MRMKCHELRTTPPALSWLAKVRIPLPGGKEMSQKREPLPGAEKRQNRYQNKNADRNRRIA